MDLDRITIDPEICLGRARVRGTRITVEFVLKLMAGGYNVADVVREYPELTPPDVLQCVSYGSWLASDQYIATG